MTNEDYLELREALLIAVRWSHAAAAAALVGGSAFYLLILDPVLRRAGDSADFVRKGAEAGFKELVDLSVVVFLISGALLTFERLSSGAADTTYAVLLGLKIVLAVFIYRWALQVRRRGWEGLEARLLVGSGFLVVLLATVLKNLYEGGLRT
jgi:uncharacterized membrane protein